MKKETLPAFRLAGIKLSEKTSNKNGQSGVDCGNLWQKFESEGVAEKIPGKESNKVYAVYFDYEGDHTQPFSYFIGCKVPPGVEIPEGLQTLNIPSQKYEKISAAGKMPECVAGAWKGIWESKTSAKRSYTFDFEVYDERSRDWNNSMVEIFLASEG